MHNGYWESVPAEYREKWADIFLNNTEGANLSEDCPVCFHYEHKHLAYVPLEWDCVLDIEPWKFMAISEPIHEIMIMNDYTKSEEGKE